MQLSNLPGKLVLPFANAGGKNSIPVDSQIGILAGAASFVDGFPPLTRTPIAAGGVPPSGLDMNGILYEMSAIVRWANAGGGYPFDDTFASDTNVGGYPKGARVMRSDGLGYWFNTVDNNVTDPEGAGAAAAGWVPDYTTGAAAVTMTSANVTLAPAQYGKPLIVITGLLTSDLNLIFPDIVESWAIINATTGAYTITAKTASGTGIAVPRSALCRVGGDGTNIYGEDAIFIQSAVGAKVRSALSKGQEWVTPPDFGIDDSGLSDAAAGINSYILNNVTSGTPYTGQANDELTIPAGVYLLNSAVTINKSHFTLNCHGCVFIVSAGHAGFVFNGADFSHIKGRPAIVMRGDTSADIAVHAPYARWCSADAEIWYNNGVTNGLQGVNCRALQIEANGADGGGHYSIYNTFNLGVKYCGWALQILNTSTTDAGSTCQANTINFSTITGGTNGLRLVGVQDNYINCQSLEFGANYGDLAGTNQIHLQMQGSPNNVVCSNNVIDIQYFETFVGNADLHQSWLYDVYSIGNVIITNDETTDWVYVDPANTWINRRLGGEEYQSPKFASNAGAGSGVSSQQLNQLRDTATMVTGVGRWSGTSATITTNNATGPDGVANSASTLVQTAVGGFVQMGTNTTFTAAELSSVKPWTFSIWLRCTTPRWCEIRMVTSSPTITVSRHVWVSTTWQRFYVTGVFGSALDKTIRVDIRGGGANEPSIIYTDLEMFGPQLNKGGLMPYQPVIGNTDMRADMIPGIVTPVDVYGRSLFLTAYDRSAGPFRQVYGAAAPVAGTWARGDICWNTAPAAGGAPGWMCVSAGTPGTWKAMANLAA